MRPIKPHSPWQRLWFCSFLASSDYSLGLLPHKVGVDMVLTQVYFPFSLGQLPLLVVSCAWILLIWMSTHLSMFFSTSLYTCFQQEEWFDRITDGGLVISEKHPHIFYSSIVFQCAYATSFVELGPVYTGHFQLFYYYLQCTMNNFEHTVLHVYMHTCDTTRVNSWKKHFRLKIYAFAIL